MITNSSDFGFLFCSVLSNKINEKQLNEEFLLKIASAKSHWEELEKYVFLLLYVTLVTWLHLKHPYMQIFLLYLSIVMPENFELKDYLTTLHFYLSPLNFLERITDLWYNFLNISVPKQGLWKAMRASKLSCRKGKSKDPAFVKKIFSLAAKFHLWRKEILCWRRKRKKKRGSCN